MDKQVGKQANNKINRKREEGDIERRKERKKMGKQHCLVLSMSQLAAYC